MERRGGRSRSGFEAQAIAAACVGAALLAGTGLSGLNRSVAGFPAARMVREVNERDLMMLGPAEPQATPAPVHGRVEAPGESGGVGGSPLLDINGADATALQTLPGVGPTLARSIVAYRALHGPFRRPEDLLRVSGIGAKRYARLQGRIRTPEAP